MKSTWRTRTVLVAMVVGAATVTAGCTSEPQLRITAATSTTSFSGTNDSTLPATTVATTDGSTATTQAMSQPTQPPTTARPTSSYRLVDPPMLDGAQTDTFTTTGPLADGRYWAQYHGGDGTSVYVTLSVAYFGPACVTKAAEFGDECLNDIFVAPTPTRDLTDLPFGDNAYVTLADAYRPGNSLLIDPAELVLASTGSPSAGAPDSFEYVNFPFIATIVNNQLIGFEQLWTP